MKRSRTPLDDYLWPIFVAACGGRCVACDAEGDLQRGHIQRQEDGGPDSLDNLQPLCAVCNGRHSKNFSMEDWRPGEWRSRFIKLLAQGLRTELRGAHPCQKNGVGCTTLDAGKPIENTEVISWERVNFAFNSALSLPLSTLTHPYPLEQYRELVDKAIRFGAKHRVHIPPPTEDCQSKLCSLVRKLGLDAFKRAAIEFLRQEKWFDEDDRGRRFRVMPQPWQTFADNIGMYLEDADEHVRQIAEQDAKAKAAEIAQEKLIKDIAARDRWNVATGTPNWPGMPDGDREFLERLRALPADQQTISDVDEQQAWAIAERYREYWESTKKYKLLKQIRFVKGLALGSEYQNLRTIAWDKFNRLEELVKAASDDGPELDEHQQQLGQFAEVKRLMG